MRFESNDGNTNIDFTSAHYEPLGIKELLAGFESEATTYNLKAYSKNISINGITQNGHATISLNNTAFHEQPYPFALVQGGWLPMPLVKPSNFLVDSNVIANLKKILANQTRTDLPRFNWWMQIFKEGTATFNPLPYAFEASSKAEISLEEFKSAFDEGTSAIKQALPKTKIIEYTNENYLVAYELINKLAIRREKEACFLVKAAPLICQKIGIGKEETSRGELIKLADETGVRLNSLAFIVTMSALYDDHHGDKFSIGRKLLKPKASYNLRNAYNALADLRSIEISAAGYVYFKDNSFSLATCDQGLTALWCAIKPSGTSPLGKDIEFTFDLPEELFPRLSIYEIEDLQSIIQRE